MTSSSKRLCIGKIASAHGVKGLVKILPFCENIELLNGTCFTEETSNKTLTITLKNPIGKYMLASVEGVYDRNAAELLKDKLYIAREDLPEIDEDEFYLTDLIGAKVLDENNTEIGIVCGVPNYGAGDLLDIKPAKGASFLIPLDHDAVKDINTDDKVIAIENPTQFIIE